MSSSIGIPQFPSWPPTPPKSVGQGVEELTVLEPTALEPTARAAEAEPPRDRSAALERLLFDESAGLTPSVQPVEPSPRNSTVVRAVRRFYGPKLGLDGHCGLRPAVPRPPSFRFTPEYSSSGDDDETSTPAGSKARIAPELLGIVLAVGLIAAVLLFRQWI